MPPAIIDQRLKRRNHSAAILSNTAHIARERVRRDAAESSYRSLLVIAPQQRNFAARFTEVDESAIAAANGDPTPARRRYHDTTLFPARSRDADEKEPPPVYSDLLNFFTNVRPRVLSIVRRNLRAANIISFALTVEARYISATDGVTTRRSHLDSTYYHLFTQADVEPAIRAAMAEIDQQNDELNEGRSDWVLTSVHSLKVKISHLEHVNPVVRGGGGVSAIRLAMQRVSRYLPAPTWMRRSTSINNIDNKDDDRCFMYCMELALMKKNKESVANTNRVTTYADRNNFEWGDLTFPIHPLDIPMFEALNRDKHNVAINAMFVTERKPHQMEMVYNTRVRDSTAWYVNLLIVSDETWDQPQTAYHWVYMNNKTGLLNGMREAARGKESRSSLKLGNRKGNEKKYRNMVYCDRCLSDFRSQTLLDIHLQVCMLQPAKTQLLPSPIKAYKYYRRYHNQRPVEFVIYSDFEAFNRVLRDPNDPDAAEDRRLTQHVASGFCCYTVCAQRPEFNHCELYSTSATAFDSTDSTQDVSKRFLLHVEEEMTRIEGLVKRHFRHPLDRSTAPMDDLCVTDGGNCVVCGLDLHHADMRHWRYTNPFQRSDFDDKQQFEFIRQGIKSGRPSDRVQELVLAKNKQPSPHWDSSRETDNYIGHAHYGCTLRPNHERVRIPVLFHNLTGYDEHLVISALDLSVFDGVKGNTSVEEEDEADGENVDPNLQRPPTPPPPSKKRKRNNNKSDIEFDAIPLAGDKFLSFTVRRGGAELNFIDTFKFMTSGLETLVKNLKSGGMDKFVHSRLAMQQHCEEEKAQFDDGVMDLMTRKGVFPYEYFDSPQRFLDTRLPDRALFYSQLSASGVDQDDYDHAQTVWRRMNCRTLRDYHDLYLRQDVALLADVFEEFRRISIEETRVDPCRYVSLPGLSEDNGYRSCLPWYDQGGLQRPFEVELFDDSQQDMYTFFEEMVRGGISLTPGRYGKANHKYMGEEYDPALPSKYIAYIDENNLYGYAMSEILPYGGYQWVTNRSERDRLISLVISGGLPYAEGNGYAFEVDGYFPVSKHDALRDYPPLPIKQVVLEEMLSPYSRSLNERYQTQHDDKSEKLLCTLEPRARYKVHYRNLMQACKLGFHVSKVHRILKFQQKRWLEPYITACTKKRAAAKNDFEKDFWKLVVNSFYGKTIQNNRKHRTVRAVTPQTMNDKKLWDPQYQDRRIINENLVMLYLGKGEVKLEQAVMVGATILEHAKWLMYDFYYDILKRHFADRCRLLFTDTDSLCVEVQTDDWMRECKEAGVLEHMDLASWPDDDSYYGANYHDKRNNKQLKKVKDEMVGVNKYDADGNVCGKDNVYITESIALRSKMYSCATTSPYQKATAKGVSRPVRKTLLHEKYKECLKSAEGYAIDKQPMLRIQSENNRLHTVTTNKVTLSPNDSKLWLLNATETYPYGHYRIAQLLSQSASSSSSSSS